ncbi:MAG: hypothetical protein ABJN26_06170 [Stappiaceae bacterium]
MATAKIEAPTVERNAAMRPLIVEAIERLISLLDDIDGDPDREDWTELEHEDERDLCADWFAH